MDELEQYRQEIDRIDAGLVKLFLERMAVTGQVGEYKLRQGIPVLDADREKRVIAARTALTDDPARKADLAALYEGIMAISRRQQRQLVRESDSDPGYAAYAAAMKNRREPVSGPRVVYQGEPGCYSEEAAAGFFGPDVDSRGLAWFPDVFAALERGEADYAVLPVENSSTGSIRQVYDLLAQYNYYIVGEWQVEVRHCLMALPGVKLEDIQTVYSHEQGLMQCEQYLDGHRDWNRVPTLDTAGSAKQVAESGDRTAAAICSRRAAGIYGLHILASGISRSMNRTRFVVVSPVMELRPGRDKISAMFRLPHQSGSLHEILTIFAVQGLNLLKIESRPIRGRRWEYLFFLDFTGDLLSPGMDGVLHELGQLAAEFRILGNFQGYEEMKNIVLIGMMGCGKSTVGRLVAERLGMAFVDTDEKIQGDTGRTIPEIFAREGEAGFRDWELGVSEELALERKLVIACGGGLPTRPDAIASLKYSGMVFWLNRDPSEIYDTVSMEDRPLGQGGKAEFLERFRQREPIYRQWADHIIEGHSQAEEAAARIADIYERECRS